MVGQTERVVEHADDLRGRVHFFANIPSDVLVRNVTSARVYLTRFRKTNDGNTRDSLLTLRRHIVTKHVRVYIQKYVF